MRLGRDIVDFVLPFFHARHVIGQRHGLVSRVFMRGRKTQQLGNAFLVCHVFTCALFQYLAELLPEHFVIVGLVFSHVFQQHQDALG